MMPIFLTFVGALLEFGHVFMVTHMVREAATTGARYGCTFGVTNAEAVALVDQILNSAFKSSAATVTIVNASVFDTAGVNPSTVNFSTLPAVTLTNMTAGQLFGVYITVPYNSVALLPPIWVVNRTITGECVMRHE
jgi:Flp pilus assembly protein TadG